MVREGRSGGCCLNGNERKRAPWIFMIKIHPHPLQRCANLLTQLPADRSSNPNNWLNCFRAAAGAVFIVKTQTDKLAGCCGSGAPFPLAARGVFRYRKPWRLAFLEKLRITNQFPGATLWHLLRSILCLRKRQPAPNFPAAPVNGLSLSQQRPSVARSNCDRKLNIPPTTPTPVLAPPFAFKHFSPSSANPQLELHLTANVNFCLA